ncbi:MULTISPECIES: TonB-dependent receptor [unclassified Novosphingobium]|uniref:TonB-dependent receptor n=1 Tax=unclassified Novosphingobium TaxID=2644732 RepID=UPI0014949225|nr:MULTISPECIES: TonB-dependent receptor [unclassified Novosphingobium]MBB3358154.1 outer membrane receptor protein involved in Fe transport [Novosphingobium sp. BK256]MBB3374515.1 outer membrane receptor protein involved in Fe transport [Novosphingobium sp. BK280]MBB3378927.1 outer membrane receptor protein involved in Fe transport [Novosphingobium sp. BK258]MBB3420621.1 outer membrane receptor protein involved in Fe transport [Novosphingobium sp. BK267]MBB3448257.1 outer membrane receptor pr
MARLAVAALVLPAVFGVARPVHAQGRPGMAPLRLPAAPLADSLRTLGLATHTTIIFAPQTVAGRRAPAMVLVGDVAAIARRLVAGSGLVVRRSGLRSLLILPAPPPRAPAPEAPPPPVLAAGDIMVTALRRPTLLADTPISMVALRGEDLGHDHATTLAGLARLAPSLTVTSAGTGFNRLSMRGAYAAGEATVALYFGNVPVAGPGGSTSDPGMMTPDLVLADVERVEVLRGPQGTLYGTSSLAGTVRVLFRGAQLDQRSLALDSAATLTQHGAAGASTTAVINLPLAAGTVALRAVGWREYQGGVIDMPRLGRRNSDDQLREGGRLALRWQIAPDWRADLAGVWQRSRIGNSHSTIGGGAPDQTAAQVIVPFFDTFAMASLDLHGRLGSGGVSLDATAARSWWRPHRFWDFTQSQLNHLDDAAACAALAGLASGSCSAAQMAGYNRLLLASSPTLVDQPLAVDVSSGEVRLSAEGRMTWTAGLFASRRSDDGQSASLGVNPATGLARPGTQPTSLRRFASQLDEYALFGDGSWRALPWLMLSGGLRYFHYARTTQSVVTLPNPFLGPFAPSSLAMATRAHGLVGRARVEARPSSRVLVYGQVSNGFRPGGSNVVPGLPQALASYADDRLESWEVGTRLSGPARSWHLDLNGFHQRWSNMQYAAVSADGSYAFITNIGTARINGAELSAGVALRGGWRAKLQGTVTDARLVQDQVSGAATTDGRAGEALPYVAPWAASVELRREWALGQSQGADGGWRGDGGLFLHYAGRAWSAFRGSTVIDRLALGGFAAIDADLAIARGPWRLGVFVQNLANGRGRVWAGTTGGSDMVTYQRPRTVGLTLHSELR